MPSRSATPIRLLAMLAIPLLAAGCLPGDGTSTPEDPAGFFWAVWHGWIAPISLVFGIFESDIRIYEVHNRGWLYDLGYYMAVIGGIGGLSLSRSRRKPPAG